MERRGEETLILLLSFDVRLPLINSHTACKRDLLAVAYRRLDYVARRMADFCHILPNAGQESSRGLQRDCWLRSSDQQQALSSRSSDRFSNPLSCFPSPSTTKTCSPCPSDQMRSADDPLSDCWIAICLLGFCC